MTGHPVEWRQVYTKLQHLFYQAFCFLFEFVFVLDIGEIYPSGFLPLAAGRSVAIR
jgi:hypothetical protein